MGCCGSTPAEEDFTDIAEQQEKFDKVGGHDERWTFTEEVFDGSQMYTSIGKVTEHTGDGSVAEWIQAFKHHPHKYVALMYQTDMLNGDWPEDQQKVVLVERAGTKGFRPQNVGEGGWMTIIMARFQALPPNPWRENDVKDSYTDEMAYKGQLLHREDNKPRHPGRGEGIADVPDLCFIKDVDPSDIRQGSVGDCWLLSGISSLAEFDGAIHRLFRKTPDLAAAPRGDVPNYYLVTLFDLTTCTEVDYEVDERLAMCADGSGLLGCKPSSDGELWACYLEKALAIHCGGWDKIDGGTCTRALLSQRTPCCWPPPPFPPRAYPTVCLFLMPQMPGASCSAPRKCTPFKRTIMASSSPMATGTMKKTGGKSS